MPLAAAWLWLPVSAQAQAQAAGGPADAASQQVVVTGSVAARPAADVPFAISVVDRDALRNAGPMINLSEALAQVPGLVVNNRSNYAQDLQISSRGFGARAGFGVRGLRLYTDGIPDAGPDGQGQVSNFDLADAQRIEVLRGPFSVLYGNSSGGVIALFTAPVRQARAEAEADLGSFGLHQARGVLESPLGNGLDLRVALQDMSIDGFRAHSQAQRTAANLRLGWRTASDRVTLLANHLDQPAQDPLGLSRAQFNADPLQTTPEATLYNTRKTLGQTQAGASWQHDFGSSVLRDSTLAVYGGRRAVMQWQAIPPGAQVPAGSAGGVVAFERDYSGAEGRLRWSWRAVDLVAGAALDSQRDDRQGYQNFVGTGASQQLGVTGALRRNEFDVAESRDVFVQAEWALSPALKASAGVRSGRVDFSTVDAYLANGNDSGSMAYSHTNPVAGLRWRLNPEWQLHASAARGIETPTLTELAYRPDGSGGLNTALKAQTSRQVELGSVWQRGPWRADATVFDVQVADELGVLTNSGGRATYQNVGRTSRQGMELSAAWQPADGWRAATALTWLDAHYRDGFLTCTSSPCKTPNVAVAAGNRIAGTQKGSAWLGLTWRDARHGEIGFDWRAVAPTAVNDVNSDAAGGYALAGLHWSRRWALAGGGQIELLARVDNLFDRRYAGSVIVNDANARFFETGAPRNLLLAVRVSGG